MSFGTLSTQVSKGKIANEINKQRIEIIATAIKKGYGMVKYRLLYSSLQYLYALIRIEIEE